MIIYFGAFWETYAVSHMRSGQDVEHSDCLALMGKGNGASILPSFTASNRIYACECEYAIRVLFINICLLLGTFSLFSPHCLGKFSLVFVIYSLRCFQNMYSQLLKFVCFLQKSLYLLTCLPIMLICHDFTLNYGTLQSRKFK